jgi:hypothetical protein
VSRDARAGQFPEVSAWDVTGRRSWVFRAGISNPALSADFREWIPRRFDLQCTNVAATRRDLDTETIG